MSRQRTMKKRLPGTITSSKLSNTDRPLRWKRSGIYLESTEADLLGVLPPQGTRVKDAMSRSVAGVTPGERSPLILFKRR
jgi:hypothetical protein